MGWKPSNTVIVARCRGDASDGYYLFHDFIRYGPWKGRNRDGYELDIWDVHEWAMKNLGICPFPTECGPGHERPDHFAADRENKRLPFDHSDLPLFQATIHE